MSVYVSYSPFGDLPLLPAAQRAPVVIFKAGCYICEDPDYNRYGLPGCQVCPLCGGHIPADDTVCSECSWDIASPLGGTP